MLVFETFWKPTKWVIPYILKCMKILNPIQANPQFLYPWKRQKTFSTGLKLVKQHFKRIWKWNEKNTLLAWYFALFIINVTNTLKLYFVWILQYTCQLFIPRCQLIVTVPQMNLIFTFPIDTTYTAQKMKFSIKGFFSNYDTVWHSWHSLDYTHVK